ncbi:MAG: hypothetical protein H7Z76_03835 [Methylotenera sp.]|nr:hypothetical protein [Flavobacterium sp.]
MNNQIFNKTTKEKYIAVNDKTINKLIELACLKCWHLYFILAKKQSFRNGLCGIFEELSLYDLMKDLNGQLNIELNTQKIKRLIVKLEKSQLIKSFNQKPFIALLTSAEQAEDLNNLAEVLEYVKHHEQEFNFHIMHKRANQFFATFKIERVAQIENTDTKANALDDLIKARPSRQPASSQELKEAMDWATVIAEEESDPFQEHLTNNKKHIKRENYHAKQNQS